MNIKDVDGEIPELPKLLMSVLIKNGYKVYVVGGAIRDILLYTPPHDFDLFTDCSGEQLLQLFPNGNVLGGEERQQKILTVVVDGVEISTFRSNGDRTTTGNSLEEHQKTCDLTINSLACDIDGHIYDSCGGLNDLKNGVVCFVGNPEDRIREDPLRVLRAIRFYCQLKFKYDSFTGKAIYNSRELVMSLPKERLREEFLKILSTDSGLHELLQNKYLFNLIPEMEKLIDLEGGTHHDEPVMHHCLLSFYTAKEISDDYRIWLAALFHDIGKGPTYTKEFPEHYIPAEGEQPDVHFYQHEIEGYKIVKDWLKEYKFSNTEIDFISTLVKLHMWHHEDGSSKKIFIKNVALLKSSNINIYEFLMICYCDHQGNLAHDRIKYGDFVKGSYLLQNYELAIKENKPFCIKDLDIDGHMVMKLGFEGVNIGKALNHLFDLVAEGELLNRRDQLIEELQKWKLTTEL